jgi:hypothetical protein
VEETVPAVADPVGADDRAVVPHRVAGGAVAVATPRKALVLSGDRKGKPPKR